MKKKDTNTQDPSIPSGRPQWVPLITLCGDCPGEPLPRPGVDRAVDISVKVRNRTYVLSWPDEGRK